MLAVRTTVEELMPLGQDCQCICYAHGIIRIWSEDMRGRRRKRTMIKVTRHDLLPCAHYFHTPVALTSAHPIVLSVSSRRPVGYRVAFYPGSQGNRLGSRRTLRMPETSNVEWMKKFEAGHLCGVCVSPRSWLRRRSQD